MPWLRSQGPLPGATTLGSTGSSLKGNPPEVDKSSTKPLPLGKTASSSSRPKANAPRARAKPLPVKSSSSSVVVPKEEPLDADAMFRCGAILEALEKDLLSVKDWGPGEYNLRKHKLVEKTVEVTTACKAYGGWKKFSQSPLITAWMAEMTRYRASPIAELDMSIFDKPPFVEEPAIVVVQPEHPPTPPRTPSVSPIKSALKRRASDSCLQAKNATDTPSAKRPRTVTTPSSLRRTLPTRPLPTRRECPSRENSTMRRLSGRKIKEEEIQTNPGLSAFEAAIFGTQSTPASASTPKRAPPRVKFILPDPPSPTSSKTVAATDPARSVKRIREDQKGRKAAQKAALDDIPKLREENNELKSTVADLINTVKSQSDTIRAMQEEQAKFRDRIDGRDAERMAMLEARLDELERGGTGQKGTPVAATAKPEAMGRAIEEALKKHREATNPQFANGLEDMKGQLRGLKVSLERYQEAHSNALRLR